MLTVKESSDELNPPIVTTGGLIGRTPPKRTFSNYLALAFATWGVGYIPGAPGTFGSAVGVGIYLLVQSASAQVFAFAAARGWSVGLLESFRMTFMLLLVTMLTIVGVWAASRTEKLLGRKDPGIVVVDEVAGQLIAFLFVPFNVGWWVIIAGFVLFRLFDIWKPYPIRHLESLESGLGIMADDVLAGIYAAILLSLLVSIYSLL
ncbi:MAG: phosphatidylglycerophosphatase [Acidobacteriota bacterium]|jgi:phosphatidylglycerophosphatase A|nr:phosphatidylglycerophosphatase [Acidobacteriota bacterium]